MSGHETASVYRSETLIRPAAPIVQSGSITGRSLMIVVAIMTFLAAITAGIVLLIASAAADWGSQVAREVTIQIRPIDGHDIEAEITRAVTIARDVEGIAAVEPLSRARSEQMLQPWLGEGLLLDELPVPRLIVVRIAQGAQPDLAALRRTLAENLAGASLDDHHFWIDRLSVMAEAMVIAGLVVLALMMIATMLSVVFATRGAMAANREIVEVLNFVGAHDSFIASQFQRHFLWLGFRGGLLGSSSAALAFIGVRVFASHFTQTAGGEQIRALFGTFDMDWRGYMAIAAAGLATAIVTGITSRITVHHVLRGHM